MIFRFVLFLFFVLFSFLAFASEVSFYSYSDALEMAENKNLPVYVLFGSDHCIWCDKQKDVLLDDKVAAELNSYVLCYVDVEMRDDFLKKYKIKSIPVSMLIRSDEKVIKKNVGYMNVADFLKWMR